MEPLPQMEVLVMRWVWGWGSALARGLGAASLALVQGLLAWQLEPPYLRPPLLEPVARRGQRAPARAQELAVPLEGVLVHQGQRS